MVARRWIKSYVSEQGLANLKTYRYSGVDNCLTTKLLNGFWNWSVSLVPAWVAPNVLTLLGLLSVLTATVLCTLCAELTADQSVPRWALLVSAVLLFAYQTLDAIDGKQARRTRSSSPLGELFDHGCDAVVFACMGPLVAAVAKTPFVIAVFCSALTLPGFYLSHWDHYFRGEMVFGLVGPCEMQLMVIGLELFVAAVGKPVWDWPSPSHLPPHSLFFGLMIFVNVFSVGTALQYIFSVCSYLRTHGRPAAHALYKLTPIATLLVLAELRVIAEPEVVNTTARYAHFIANGLVFAYVTQRLMVQRLFREPIVQFFSIYIPMAFCVVNGFLRGRLFPIVPVAWAMAALSVVQEGIFVVSFVRQISSHLNIRPFSITPSPPPRHESVH